MSNLIIVPKKNGYLVRNQNNNSEMAVFKTKQDAQLFIKNYKAGKLNVHSHEHNHMHNNNGSMPMHSQQFPTSVYPNMMYPHMQGQMYPPNMMYPHMQGQMYPPNMMYPHMQGQMYPPNMMYPAQQFPPTQPYNPNMMMVYGMQNNMPHSAINQQCECGYIYNNEYEGGMDEEDDFLDFETDSPELIKPPEISEMNKTLDEKKTEVEKSNVNEPIEQIHNEQKRVIEEQEQIITPKVVEEALPVVNSEPIVVEEPTMMMSDLTNFSIEDDNELSNINDKPSVQKQIYTTNLSKKELKNLKKQQKQELKLIKKQEKRNKHIYDEMEDYDF